MPNAGEKASLSREAYVAAALAFIDERGLDEFTLRSLGREMGVHGTAVYRYFRSRDDLLEAVLAHMLEVSGVEIPAKGAPRARLLALLRGLRRSFSEHPNLALPNLTMQAEQATAVIVNEAVALLEQMGLHGSNLAVGYQMLETFSVGSNAYDWGGYPDALEARRRGRRLSGNPAFDASSRSIEDMQALNDEAFELAAEALLDACESLGGADSA